MYTYIFLYIKFYLQMNIINIIRLRIKISDVLKKILLLKKKSCNNYIGLCPFHKEKTPSFFINDLKNVFYCFGCGISGNVFSFLMSYYKMPYYKVLKILSNICGKISIKKNKNFYINNQKSLIKTIYYKVFLFYKNYLYKKVGIKALNYILMRKISIKTIDKYYIGYAIKNSQIFINFLTKYFNKKELIFSGILRCYKNKLYNPLYGRVIFPIHNIMGEIIGFGGRIIDGDRKPKYLNSAENIIFYKKNYLYGLNIAINYINKEKKVIIVEGYMDVITLSEHGIYYSVSPLGTSINFNQIKKLWEFCYNPIICFDNDTAGMKATKRIAYIILPFINEKKSLKFCLLKKAKDPDDFINKWGIKKFNSIIKHSIHLSEFIFQQETDSSKILDIEQKISLKKKIMNLINKIKDISSKEEYKKHLMEMYFNYIERKQNYLFYNINNFSRFFSFFYSKNVFFYTTLLLITKYPKILQYNNVFENILFTSIPSNLVELRNILLNLFVDSVCNKYINYTLYISLFFKKIVKNLLFIKKIKCKNENILFVKKTLNLLMIYDLNKEVKKIKKEILMCKNSLNSIKLIKKIFYLKYYENKVVYIKC